MSHEYQKIDLCLQQSTFSCAGKLGLKLVQVDWILIGKEQTREEGNKINGKWSFEVCGRMIRVMLQDLHISKN